MRKNSNRKHKKQTRAKKRVAIYRRVSTGVQAKEGISLDAQLDTLSKYCEMRDWEIYKVYTDAGISAKSTNREEYQRLLIDAKNDLFDIVLVWKLTRFSRNLQDFLNDCSYLEKYDVSFISYSEQFDCSMPIGRLIRNILAVFAEFEREVIGENVAENLAYRAKQGKRTVAFVLGYDIIKDNDQVVLNKKEAELVKFIDKNFLKLKSYKHVANLVNAKGYKGKDGGKFTSESIKKIIRRPIYAGYYTFNGEAFKGNFETIRTVKDHNKMQKIVEDIARKELEVIYL